MDINYVPKPKQSKKKSGGAKKIGRNLKKCAIYRSEGRREKNKARKIAKEARRQEKLRLRKLKLGLQKEKKSI